MLLQYTFSHIRGIKPEKERQLWRQGVLSWEEFERHVTPQHSLPFGNEDSRHAEIIDRSRTALANNDVAFFAEVLDRKEHYRIALTYPSDVLFLDIETTGLSRYYDSITMIGWSRGSSYEVHIRGQNDSELRSALRSAKVLVTFNGTMFDVPFLKKEFPDIEIPNVHVDLRFLSKRAGMVGGQKVIEEMIGLRRPAHLLEVDGKAAPLLWHRYRRGDIQSLRLLIEYNHADLEGMKSIFDQTIDKFVHEIGFPEKARKHLPKLALASKLQWANGHNKGISIQPYQGSNRPQTTYKSLFTGFKGHKPRIVGIDLTGSESRPSGWCLLDKQRASTDLLGTDEEIISATLKTKPDLISIDSPLSLPAGRVTVFDTDPGRQEFGIMRYCERILKKRGVNVYPALIPSMQRLTARGIALAKRFRSEGIPVIESYPGAAQDILNIPRKRASLDLLREGLVEFGFSGRFVREPLSHDELDAITSALVGVFFWAGKFEALGNSEEEALIIPDLHIDSRNWRHRLVIGISGPVAVGKTAIATQLAKHSYEYGRYSAVIKEILASNNADRRKLQKLGKTVHDSKGQRWLGRELLKRLPPIGNLVIDGLRFPDDHAFLVESFGPAFLHFHLTASAAIRKKRFSLREGSGSDFSHAENADVEKEVAKLKQLAQFNIDANATLATVFRRVCDQIPNTDTR